MTGLELEYKKLFFIAFIGREQTIYGLISETFKKVRQQNFHGLSVISNNHLSVVVVLLILLLYQYLLIVAVN